MELRLCYLEPTFSSRPTKRGDVVAVVKRCLWRGIDLRLAEMTPADAPDFPRYDLVFIGGGGAAERHFLVRDMRWLRRSGFVEAVEAGVVTLALGGAYPLLGRYQQTARRTIEGLGLLDLWTEPGETPLRGLLATHVRLPNLDTYLVGHESHRSRTHLGHYAKALGHVLNGGGNNSEDGSDGAVYKNLFASYLQGPLLPRNPEFLDYLFQLALERKYGQEFYLPPMPNLLEDRAHQVLLRRMHLEEEAQTSPPSTC
ncbi:MAG: type 1 glutamine amidotransferase [Symbiobacteriia bacterium]